MALAASRVDTISRNPTLRGSDMSGGGDSHRATMQVPRVGWNANVNQLAAPRAPREVSTNEGTTVQDLPAIAGDIGRVTMEEKMKARAAICERRTEEKSSSGASSSTQEYVYSPTMIAEGLVAGRVAAFSAQTVSCLLYTSPSPRDRG